MNYKKLSKKELIEIILEKEEYLGELTREREYLEEQIENIKKLYINKDIYGEEYLTDAIENIRKYLYKAESEIDDAISIAKKFIPNYIRITQILKDI